MEHQLLLQPSLDAHSQGHKESDQLKRRDLSDRWQEMRTGQMTVAMAGTFQELGIKEMLLNKSLKPRDYKHG